MKKSIRIEKRSKNKRETLVFPVLEQPFFVGSDPDSSMDSGSEVGSGVGSGLSSKVSVLDSLPARSIAVMRM